MKIPERYQEPGPTRADVDALPGLAVLEFGANGCGYCAAAQPALAEAFADRPEIPYFKVADGPGRVLGRSFKVKLWPTVIVLRDGKEVGRVVRPDTAEEVARTFP